MLMRLRNLFSLTHGESTEITVQAEKIADIGQGMPGAADENEITFENAIVFPGLINSHDHLEFNLYPRLGGPKYANYTEWGSDIHQVHSGLIARIQKIPKTLRTDWGVFKNILNGVTTVVNHGERIHKGYNSITVHERCDVLHSVKFEKH